MPNVLTQYVQPSYATGFARSASDSEYPQLWNGLVAAYLPCLGPTNYTLADCSAFNRHATLVGCEPIQNSIIPDDGQYALNLDGVNDHAFLAPGNGFSANGTTQISVSLWFKANVSQSAKSIFHIPNVSGSQHSVLLQIVNATTLRYYVFAGAAAPATDITFTHAGAGWTHAAWTYDGRRVAAYLNGAFRHSSALTGTINAAANEINIGRYGTFGQYFQGLIDDVRVWNRALEPDEINVLSLRRGVGFERKRMTYLPILRRPVTYNENKVGGGVVCAGLAGKYVITSRPTSGGVVSAGLAGRYVLSDKPTSGGVVSSGLGSPSLQMSEAGVGGVLAGGTALQVHVMVETGDGGVVASGTVSLTSDYNPTLSGGVVISGQSGLYGLTNEQASGGVVAGGLGSPSLQMSEASSGGVVASGVAEFYRLLIGDTSGGVVAGGASNGLLIFNPATSGGVVVGKPRFANGYQFRTRITVPSGTVGANLSKFPLGVRFPVVAGLTISNIQATDGSGNPLPSTLIRNASDQLWAYVRTDLASAADTEVFIYYGD